MHSGRRTSLGLGTMRVFCGERRNERQSATPEIPESSATFYTICTGSNIADGLYRGRGGYACGYIGRVPRAMEQQGGEGGKTDEIVVHVQRLRCGGMTGVKHTWMR